jgi:hypothetical protein
MNIPEKMDENNKPIGADSFDEVFNQESQENLSEESNEDVISGSETEESDEVLKTATAKVSEILGRNFSSWDEASKTLKGLKSLVGDQTREELKAQAKQAEEYRRALEKFAKANDMTLDEAIKTMEGFVVEETPETSEVQKLREELEEFKFLQAHSEAKNYLDDIRALARGLKISLEEAFNRPVIQQLISNQSKSGVKEAILKGSGRISSSPSDYLRAFENAKKTGDWSEVLKQKGVI